MRTRQLCLKIVVVDESKLLSSGAISFIEKDLREYYRDSSGKDDGVTHRCSLVVMILRNASPGEPALSMLDLGTA